MAQLLRLNDGKADFLNNFWFALQKLKRAPVF